MKKTALTIATFIALLVLPQIAPALKGYESIDWHKITALLNLPLPKPKAEAPVVATKEAIKRPQYLIDPKHELDHFYEALLKNGTVRILHYGDSPTTGDLITADARAMLQKQFGDAGSGFVLIARPWAWYNHRGVEMDASSHWKIDIAGIAQLKDGMHGLGGVSFIGSTGATAHWRLRNGAHATIEIAYLAQADGGAFEVDADDKPIGEVDTNGDKGPGYASFKIPPGAANFAVRVTRGTVRLYGAEFRKASAGVIYSSLGVNGANITLLSHAFNERHWAAELHHYKPDLVVVNYGTNESGFAKFVETTWAPEMKEAVRRLKAALHTENEMGGSILLMSPMDRGERNKAGEIETIGALPRLVDIESHVANETNVAFFNTFQAMGGPGTMGRWYNQEPRLVGADFIHPMPAGAKIVGELLYNALRDGYNEYKLRQLTASRAVSESSAVPQK
jgi:lysophospholipase L1-like esterase